MAIVAGFMVPHPPLIVHEIGRGEEKEIKNTLNAYEDIARQIAILRPETILLISPHTVCYTDYNHISPGQEARGDFRQFGAPGVSFSMHYDTELVEAFAELLSAQGLHAGTQGERDAALDHGTMVPLYFINKHYTNYKLIRMGISGLPLIEQYKMGVAFQQAVQDTGRRVVIIASGDLSHHYNKKSPYGYHAAGPEYDEKIMATMGSGRFMDLLFYPQTLCQNAGECGHRAFTIMAGALDGKGVVAKALSHEGPFGVGYGVCTFRVIGHDAGRKYLQHYEEEKEKRARQAAQNEDPYVRLARQSLECMVRTGKKLKMPEGLAYEMVARRAGVFVSLHKGGALRGCIGTIGPAHENVAAEIIANAIEAGFHDPRFLEVKEAELKDLIYSVDVLGPMEEISSERELDPKRYGVVVTKGSRTGLLLPNLEGIDTVEQQVDIAKRKAYIRPEETGVILQRFEVIRHE